MGVGIRPSFQFRPSRLVPEAFLVDGNNATPVKSASRE